MGFTLIKWEFPIHLLRMTVVLPFSDILKIKGCFALTELGPAWLSSSSFAPGDPPLGAPPPTPQAKNY